MLTTFVVSQMDEYHEVMTEGLDQFKQIEAEETELHKKEEEEIKAAVAEIMARYEEQKTQVSARKTDAMEREDLYAQMRSNALQEWKMPKIAKQRSMDLPITLERSYKKRLQLEFPHQTNQGILLSIKVENERARSGNKAIKRNCRRQNIQY